MFLDEPIYGPLVLGTETLLPFSEFEDILKIIFVRIFVSGLFYQYGKSLIKPKTKCTTSLQNQSTRKRFINLLQQNCYAFMFNLVSF